MSKTKTPDSNIRFDLYRWQRHARNEEGHKGWRERFVIAMARVEKLEAQLADIREENEQYDDE